MTAVDRYHLQELSRTRQREARLLLASGEWSDAYYVSGYAAECALKACIARATRPNEFPDKNFAEKVWTHDLVRLVAHAGLEPELQQRSAAEPDFEINWGIVKDWSEKSRYDLKSEPEARDLLRALSARKYGILPWIRRRW